MSSFIPTVALAAALLVTCAVDAIAQGSPAAASDSTVVVMLGTGTPRPTPEASGPATAVVVGRRVFVFDAGVDILIHEVQTSDSTKHPGQHWILADIRRSFPGPVVIAADLQRFSSAQRF